MAKHIKIHYHVVRELIRSGFLTVQHIASENQLADLFTKGLCAPMFTSLLHQLLGVSTPTISSANLPPDSEVSSFAVTQDSSLHTSVVLIYTVKGELGARAVQGVLANKNAQGVEVDAIESYISEVSKLAMTLLEMMCKALKIESGVMAEVFEGGMQAIRMNYYPPCTQSDLVMGCTPHSDFGGLTILLQLNGVESSDSIFPAFLLTERRLPEC
ncbi:gibberellin 20 oxidase 2-like [Papaver somniferum]|uniref:gibberellin 20 oxidase 2-like n=1 Tax=Papaver somniferum TaxID=3469 RepID=UPI000E700C89|nr:gibberellin 20 oxidase 2-like [Papaver somniferum]